MKTISTLCATSTIGVAACGFVFGRPLQVPDNNSQPDAIAQNENTRSRRSDRDHQHHPHPHHPHHYQQQYRQSPRGSPYSSTNVLIPKQISAVQAAEPIPIPSASSYEQRRQLMAGASSSALTTSSQETNTPPASIEPKRTWLRRLSSSLHGSVGRPSRSPSPHGSTHTANTTLTSNTATGISPGTVAKLVQRFSTVTVGSRPGTANRSSSLMRSNSKRSLVAQPTTTTPTRPRRPSTFGFSTTKKPQRGSIFSSFGMTSPSADARIGDITQVNPYDPEPVESWRMYFQSRLVVDKSKSKSRRFSIPSPMKMFRRIYPNSRYQPTLLSPGDVTVAPDDEDYDSDEISDDSDWCADSLPPSPADNGVPHQHKRKGSIARRSLSISGMINPNAAAKRRRRFTNIAPPEEIQQQEEDDTDMGQYEFEDARQHLTNSDGSASPGHPITHQDEMDIDHEPESMESSHEFGSDTQRTRRLSLIMSEHASTLVGSDDNDQDFRSDTVFDSIRTRASPSHPPLGLDTIFQSESSEPFSVFVMPSSPISPVATRDSQTPRANPRAYGHENASNNERLELKSGADVPRNSFSNQGSGVDEDDDDDSWASDWDAPLSPMPDSDVYKQNLSAELIREGTNLTFPRSKLHNRQSSGLDSFAIGSSVSKKGRSSEKDTTLQPNANATNTGKLEAPKPAGRKRAPSTHLRSQSLPTVGDPSENWDDDFDDSNGTDVVVPNAIKDTQKNIMTHLNNVKDFAKQIDDLKKIYTEAVVRGIRYGDTKKLWDEAESIVILATVDSGETTISRSRTPLPMDGFDDTPPNSSTENLPKKLSKKSRRASVLSPDDDIFGLNFKAKDPKSRQGSPHPKVNTSNPKTSTAPTKATTEEASVNKVPLGRSKSEHVLKNSACPSLFRKAFTDRGEKLHFDSEMLPDLTSHIKSLKKYLHDALKDGKPPVSTPDIRKPKASKPNDLEFFKTWSGFEEDSLLSSKLEDTKLALSPRDISQGLPSPPADDRVPKSENVNQNYPQNSAGRRKSRMGLEDNGTRRSSLMTFV